MHPEVRTPHRSRVTLLARIVVLSCLPVLCAVQVADLAALAAVARLGQARLARLEAQVARLHSAQRTRPRLHARAGETSVVHLCRDRLGAPPSSVPLYHQARLVPVRRRGAVAGAKIYATRPGSLFSVLGVRSGDVLRGVDGAAVRDVSESLAQLSQLIGKSPFFELSIERCGVPQRIVVLVHDRCTPVDQQTEP